MGKIKTNTQKRLEPKKQKVTNKTIVLIKIGTACLLLLGCSLFFFANMSLFWDDLKSFISVVFFFPIVFFVGLLWICIYIVNLAGHIDDKDLHHADRYDWLYKIVFITTVMSMVCRSFIFYGLNVPAVITTICVISGLITLFTPKIMDNNNDEF